MKKLAVPRWIKSYALFILANWLVFTAFRCVFLYVFRTSLVPEVHHQLWTAFYVGAKFDARLACALAAILGLYLTVCAFWKGALSIKKAIAWLYGLLEAAVLLVYFADFAHYAYIAMRINYSIFKYSENALISLQMAWQTYPLVWAVIGLLVWGVANYFFVKKLIAYAFSEEEKYHWKGKLGWFFGGLLVTAALMFGQISQYPLRWSNAYHSTNNFICNLTLNPGLNIFDTYRFAGNVSFDREAVEAYYNDVAAFLGVTNPDKETLNFRRNIPGKPKAEQKDYNVVVIFMESFAWNKVSMTNPDLNPTPFTNELVKKSILFNNFFSPTSATARAVFATVTGIPDVTSFKTSSRNPLIVDQHVVVNALRDYEKYYFIGGSSSWGNIRGILEHNLTDVHMYEEGKFENEHRNDVWGISDLDLFREANRILEKDHKETGKPFFAIIQTAGYHRPYTIPEDNAGFEPANLPDAIVQKRSFGGLAEYNSLKLSDHFLKVFFDLAKQSGYYKNTLFVIFGDHGLSAAQSENMPRGYVEHNLINHQIPLILAGDVIKEPKVITRTASQVDILPIVMGILGRPYYTRAIGRDVLSDDKLQEGALIYGWAQQPHPIGLVAGEYFYNSQGEQEGLYKYASADYNKDISAQEPERFNRMKRLAMGLYETSQYLEYNNKKQDEQDD